MGPPLEKSPLPGLKKPKMLPGHPPAPERETAPTHNGGVEKGRRCQRDGVPKGQSWDSLSEKMTMDSTRPKCAGGSSHPRGHPHTTASGNGVFKGLRELRAAGKVGDNPIPPGSPRKGEVRGQAQGARTT